MFVLYLGAFFVGSIVLLVGGLPSDDPVECDGEPIRPGQACLQGPEGGVGTKYSYAEMAELTSTRLGLEDAK